MAGALRVLIVDPSISACRAMAGILEQDAAICVSGCCHSPEQAEEWLSDGHADVIIADGHVVLSRGASWLEALSRKHAANAVVAVDSGQTESAFAASDAVIVKPRIDDIDDLIVKSQEITASVRNLRTRSVPQPAASKICRTLPKRLVALGASTGGTDVLCDILAQLEPDHTAYTVVQHISSSFTQQFVARLNDSSKLSVEQALDGTPVLAGCVYVAPGDQHLRLVRDGQALFCRVDRGERVGNHRPSVDVLLSSLTEAPIPVLGVLLTGMGRDGADGMRNLRHAGHTTFAQDEASSAVWGMPGAAVAADAVDALYSGVEMAHAIQGWSNSPLQKVRSAAR